MVFQVLAGGFDRAGVKQAGADSLVQCESTDPGETSGQWSSGVSKRSAQAGLHSRARLSNEEAKFLRRQLAEPSVALAVKITFQIETLF